MADEPKGEKPDAHKVWPIDAQPLTNEYFIALLAAFDETIRDLEAAGLDGDRASLMREVAGLASLGHGATLILFPLLRERLPSAATMREFEEMLRRRLPGSTPPSEN